MEILRLKYFLMVVESNFNISVAANKLYLSQPALTQAIRKFEFEERVDLFVRRNGRLCGLTAAGETFLNNANLVLNHYDCMMKELREHSSNIKGKVRIGIPPLILTVLFTRVLAQLVVQNPEIHFDIVEEGAFTLQKKLLLQELDFAVLLQPTDLETSYYTEDLIFQDELSCFLRSDHPLSHSKKLSWADLREQTLAIFPDAFMIHHQVMRKFQSLGFVPKIALQSSSWDFLLALTSESDFITILPAPIRDLNISRQVSMVRLESPIPWKVVLAYPNKGHYSRIEEYTRQSLCNFFVSKQAIVSINVNAR